MALSRSTFYDTPAAPLEDAEIVSRMQAICDESRHTDTGAWAPSLANETLLFKIRLPVRVLQANRTVIGNYDRCAP